MILRQNLRCSKNKQWHRRSFALRCNRFYICCTGMFCFSCPPIWTSRRKTHRKLSSSLFLKCFFFYKTHFYNMQHGFMVLCGASSLSTNLKCGDEYPSNLYKFILTERGVWLVSDTFCCAATDVTAPTESWSQIHQLSLGLNEETEESEAAKSCRRNVASSLRHAGKVYFKKKAIIPNYVFGIIFKSIDSLV